LLKYKIENKKVLKTLKQEKQELGERDKQIEK